MTDVRYRPGAADAWRIAVSGEALAALPPSVTPLVTETVWRRLGDGGVGAMIEALTGAFGTSLAAIPDFALAVVEGGGAGQGGGVRVVVRGAVDVRVDDGETVRPVSGAGVATWVERHIPGARAVSIDFACDAGGEETLPLVSGIAPASAVVLTVDDAAGADDGARTVGDAVAPPEVAPEPAPGATRVLEVVTDAPPLDTLLPLATIEPEPVASEVGAEIDETDLVWGATIARPRPARTGSAPAAPAAEPAPELAALGDHDGETIAVADLRAMRQAQREQYESTENVPPRLPPQGRIRLSTGRVVELERPVVIGRRPKSTRTTGAELPTLIAVDSPDQDISRSHVEIRTESEHVLVTDLDTTNGTVLLRGGQEPVRLHPGEPTMVVSGDVLDIGDGVTIAFEDLP